MRGPTLLTTITLALAGGLAPPAALAQTPEPAATGGAAYDPSAPDPRRPVVEGDRARRLPSGLAAAPAAAPARVQRAIWAANEIVGRPYRYGGGHATFKDTGYDCSGTVSYALRGARLVRRPMASGAYTAWGRPGRGRWITTYANGGHMYVVIAGLRLDTSSAGERRDSGEGPRWRDTTRAPGGFVARHPKGL